MQRTILLDFYCDFELKYIHLSSPLRMTNEDKTIPINPRIVLIRDILNQSHK